MGSTGNEMKAIFAFPTRWRPFPGSWRWCLLFLSFLLGGGITAAREEGTVAGGWRYFIKKGKRVVLALEGDRAFMGKVIKIEGVRVTWYPEEDPLRRVVMVAERGSLDAETDDLQVEGKVRAVSPVWGKINANQIEWKAKEEKIIARGNARARFKLPRKKASTAD